MGVSMSRFLEYIKENLEAKVEKGQLVAYWQGKRHVVLKKAGKWDFVAVHIRKDGEFSFSTHKKEKTQNPMPWTVMYDGDQPVTDMKKIPKQYQSNNLEYIMKLHPVYVGGGLKKMKVVHFRPEMESKIVKVQK